MFKRKYSDFNVSNSFQEEIDLIDLIEFESSEQQSQFKASSIEKIIPSNQDKILDSLSFHNSYTNNFISESPEELFSCLICNLNLEKFSDEDKEKHIEQCSENLTASPSVNNLATGIKSKEFSCIICDVNLSRKTILSRCLHIKKCAKDNKISTREIIKNLYDLEESESEDEEEVQILLQKNQNSDRSIVNNTPKNALAILMNAAKDQKKLNGFIQTNETKILAESQNKKSKKSLKGLVAENSNTSNTKSNNWGNQKKSFTSNNKITPENSHNYAPAYKQIKCDNMTIPIIVDGFQYASSTLSDTYFLTHYHSDHYTGLTKDFNYGRIYCSPTTANLVRLKIKVEITHIVALELERKYTIEIGGVKVDITFTDANHCPGAVCILFEFPNGKSIFHTGDFRWSSSLLRSSLTLRNLSQNSTKNAKYLTVYLDTTYCNKTYTFPPQDIIINSVVECVKAEKKISNTLFVFGAYDIGKEKLYMAASYILDSKIYVDKTRWRSILCYDWSMEDKAKIITEPNGCKIWVVGLSSINFNSLEEIKKKSGFSRIVAFQPTGWTHSTNSKISVGTNYPGITLKKKDDIYIYSVSYSEHSSFTELIDFIQTTKPFRIVPTVNTSKEKVEEQLKLIKECSGIYNTLNKADNSTNSNEFN